MPIRNPFRKGDQIQDENLRPELLGRGNSGFQRTDVTATPLNDKANGSNQQTEYKLSEINDSGVYLPPSPTHEKPSFWQTKSNASITSSNHRSVLGENEPFNISRESFDSYRRSFDISARSPILDPEHQRPRHSLDARRMRLPAAAQSEPLPKVPVKPADEDFEDVRLNDDAAKPKRRSIFSRFGDSDTKDVSATPVDKPLSSHYGTHLFGRKRGHSGQGQELGNVNRPGSTHAPEVKTTG